MSETTFPPNTHPIPEELMRQRVTCTLVGAGGNGSKMLTGLGCLHQALKALGRGGLQVNVFDPDIVTSANVGRQLFSPADVGQYKSLTLVHRVNCFFGTDWKAFPVAYKGAESFASVSRAGYLTDVLITCVDTAKARADIHRGIVGRGEATPRYWLDLGNDKTFGQVVLGEPCRHSPRDIAQAQTKFAQANKQAEEEARKYWGSMIRPRLPTIIDRTPELLDKGFQEENTPSCSLAEALGKQDLFINNHVADWALHLLWTMLRQGWVAHHGYFINLESGKVNPVPVPTAQKKEA